MKKQNHKYTSSNNELKHIVRIIYYIKMVSSYNQAALTKYM
jgi:hypothetical protein